MAKVVCLKLTTGEDLIAKITLDPNLQNEDPFSGSVWSLPKGESVLEDIRVMTVQPVSPGQMGMALIPWALGDHEAKLKVDLTKHAAGIYPARKEIEDSYIQQTSSLTIPKSSIQLS